MVFSSTDVIQYVGATVDGRFAIYMQSYGLGACASRTWLFLIDDPATQIKFNMLPSNLLKYNDFEI